MSDQDTYENDAAQKIAEMVNDAENGREAAVDYIRDHDVIRALFEASRRIHGESYITPTIDYDQDTTDTGEVIGFRVYDSGEVKLKYKSMHGTGNERIESASSAKLLSAVRLLDSTAFQSAAVEAVSDLTARSIAAGQATE